MSDVTKEIKEKSKLTKEEWRDYTKTVWHIANTTDKQHPAVFPIEIPHRLIKLFSFYGETVLDPFAGVGTTALAALPLGRNAVCVDQNQTYTSDIKNRCKNFTGNSHGKLIARTADSRKMNFIENESIGIIVSSPPYWNKADYGENDINIGNERVYTKFLENITPIFKECYRVLGGGPQNLDNVLSSKSAQIERSRHEQQTKKTQC